jgi:hypothetical protein
MAVPINRLRDAAMALPTSDPITTNALIAAQ